MTRRANGTGGVTAAGYVHICCKRVVQYEHIRKAEKAIGKPLPHGCQVHHVDEKPANNANSNLVICPDQKYHRLLHRRTNAFNACGNANFLICRYCRKYDAPANLKKNGSRSFSHPDCRNTHRRKIYKGNTL